MNRICTLICVGTLILATGCTSAVKNTMRLSEKSSQWNPLEKLTKSRKEQSKESKPVTMAAIWKDTTVSVPGKQTMRGFGGRIYFYDADNNPVKAEGEMVVYGFDNDSGDSTKPEKKFVFKADKFQEHFSESALGASYSLWIPWDAAGGYQKSITLIPIFKTDDTRVIQTGQSINVLPGRQPEMTNGSRADLPYRFLGSSSAVIGSPESKSKSRQNGVTRASYTQDDVAAEDINKVKLRVSSISLTKNLQKLVENAQKNPGKTDTEVTSKPSDTYVAAKQETRVPQTPVSPNSPTSLDATKQPKENGKASRSVYGAPGPIYR